MLIYSFDRTDKETRCFKENNTQCSETLKIRSLKSIISLLNQPNSIDLSSSLIFDKYSLKNEDFEASYVTLIKFLIRNADSNTLNTFYYTTRNDFKYLKPLLKFCHHSDVMVKNAARIGLMTIVKKCTGDAMECIKSIIMPQHVKTVILHLKKTALDVQNSMKFNKHELEKACQCYEEELEYVDDLLNLNYAISEITMSDFLNDFILNFVLTAIISEKMQQEILTPIVCKIGLYLLSKCFEKITNKIIINMITELVLQKKNKQPISEEHPKYITLLADSFYLILTEHKMQVEALYALHILCSILSYISGDLEKKMKFYNKFLGVFIKFLMFIEQSNDGLEFIKLRLLGLCVKPLIQGNETNEDWLKLRKLFAQTLEIVYTDICKHFQQENIYTLISIVDDEYEIFIKEKTSKLSLNDASFLFEEKYNTNEVLTIKKAINYFFVVRELCLGIKGLNEKILPILKNKENIGDILEIADCMPCKKLTHNKVYMDNHFIKFTNRQLLVLQKAENELESQGIVVFNSYYKDITWIKYITRTLSICESCAYSGLRVQKYLNPFCIHLKFNHFDEFNSVVNLLTEAKKRQMQIIRRKLTDLFQL